MSRYEKADTAKQSGALAIVAFVLSIGALIFQLEELYDVSMTLLVCFGILYQFNLIQDTQDDTNKKLQDLNDKIEKITAELHEV